MHDLEPFRQRLGADYVLDLFPILFSSSRPARRAPELALLNGRIRHRGTS